MLPATHARKGRRHQFVFLNGRPVEDAVISRALAEGFRGAVSEGLHPAAWLWIDLEPTLVDVNVHPAKREVRFTRPLDVKDAILESVMLGLRPAARAPEPPRSPAVTSDGMISPRAEMIVPVPRPVAVGFHAPQPELTEWVEPEPVEPTVAPTGGGPAFRILGLLQRRLVVMESDDGLVLFDPKAAKERILYENLLQQRDGSLAVQALLVPVLLELDPRDLDVLMRERIALAEAGIELESFGGNTVQIRALPACLGIGDPRGFIGGLLDELLHDPATGARFAFDRVARTLARRAASLVEVRLNEAEPLLAELFACDLPYCTADGRPTLTEFGMRELEKRFGISKG